MSLWSDLYNGETQVDFPRQWRVARVISAALLAISVFALTVLGLNLGLDFEGGSSWEVRAPGVSVAEARDVLRQFGEAEAKIQIVDGDVIRVQAPVKDPAKAAEISTELAKLGEFLGVQSVGPSWGQEITRQAIKALVVFFVLLALFMAWRLEWKMAVGAIIAVLHDVVISVGVYALFGLVVTPATVVSFLTIMGYSLYDTIVVFDKARDLTSRPSITSRFTYTEIMSGALNQVLMRSLNTTIMGLFPVTAMLIVGRIQGADTLLEFAVALFVGLVVGAYSSLYIAAPIVARLKEREPKHAAVRQRLAARGEVGAKRAEALLVGAGAPARAAAGATAAAAAEVEQAVARAAPSGAIPPRPRKKKRR